MSAPANRVAATQRTVKRLQKKTKVFSPAKASPGGASATSPVKASVDATLDGEPSGFITAYASKLPLPETSGDASTDRKMIVAHRNCMKLISFVQNDIMAGSTFWNEVVHQSEEVKSTDAWDDSVINISRLPRYFLGQVIVAADPNVNGKGFTRDITNKIDGRGSQAIRQVFQALAMCGPSLQVPLAARRDKTLTFALFVEILQRIGSVPGWCERYVNPATGEVAWPDAGPFKIHYADSSAGKATQIEYKYLPKEDPARMKPVTVTILRAFDYDLPWDPWEAVVYKGDSVHRYKLCQFWSEKSKEGPWIWAWDKKGTKITDICNEVKAREERAKQTVVPTYVEDSDFLGQDLKEKKRQALLAATLASKEKGKRARTFKAA